ncbi:MAG: SDR family oxidoreductase [Clostridiales bacterium]
MKSNKYKRIAIVTGATSGIGEATVRIFISAGFGVIGNGRNKRKIGLLEKELGSAFCGVVGDITENDILELLFTCANNHFHKNVDIVIANAGHGLMGSVTNADLSQFENILKINVTSTLNLLQNAALRMVEKQKVNYPRFAADIIIIGSVVGRNISPFNAVYGASKFAIHSLAESLRQEISTTGVRVSLVEPGAVETNFQSNADYSENVMEKIANDYGPLITAEDVANAIYFLVTQPPNVHISNIVIRPTRLPYP